MSARVLVVDDILPNVKLLEAKLSSEYYEVLTATSGMEALEKVITESPDIILLDVMMPGMDGFEVCAAIKSNPDVAHIPVVMVTALTDSSDRVRGLEAGADDFLSKPLNDTALMARVRSLVRLKMTVDEWRAREITASQLGVSDKAPSVMSEPVENAKILVIEDMEFEHDKVIKTLEKDNDDVTIVTNGPDAMTKISEQAYDLLVVSLNLEQEDGLRLCSHLRSAEKTRSIPILMIAEDDDMSRIAHGLEIGAHDYILRPIDTNELLARVRTQIRRKRFQERLRASYEVSLSMALTDPLTGLYNRRYFEVHFQKLLQKNMTSRKPMSVLMMDIDHFKAVNDTYGHGVGDEILKEFALRVQDKLRGFDLVARMGGEEFAAILPDVSEETAYIVAERLRRSISNHPFKCAVPEGQISVMVSIGGTIIQPGTQQALDVVLKQADDALYAAKGNGRDQCFFDGVGKLNPEDHLPTPRQFIKD
ncbi:MAG: PleD family two-component system response regulator [Alphaproteobacteria bacterium]|nr:PleD family two-component system response regulator [Alphaproteobacteria bacterium]NCQ87423.1 PleD family two-component system response regulator [Alphaproteobacteria bacterium]NCT06294.1 PleD family two-component system response regulator [Alphaproteobacteria bacterium]